MDIVTSINWSLYQLVSGYCTFNFEALYHNVLTKTKTNISMFHLDQPNE